MFADPRLDTIGAAVEGPPRGTPSGCAPAYAPAGYGPPALFARPGAIFVAMPYLPETTLPEVTLTALVAAPKRYRPRQIAVARLTDRRGRGLSRYRPVTVPLRRGAVAAALAGAIADALAALQRPARVNVVCNHPATCRRLRNGAIAAGPHALTVKHRRGDAMGEAGRRAYRAGVRQLERTAAAE